MKGHIWKNGWKEGFQKAWESDMEGEIFDSCGTWLTNEGLVDQKTSKKEIITKGHQKST